MKYRRAAVVVAAAVVALGLPAVAAPSLASAPSAGRAASFEVGAAQVDITPPALDTPLGQRLDAADFIPACGSSEAAIAKLWPGKRLFAFEDPYLDLFGKGQYVPGDPFCDADLALRYQAPYIGGGSGVNHWPLTSADLTPAMNTAATTLHNPNLTNDPITAQAVVFAAGGTRLAMVTVNSIGIFDSTMDQIRADVESQDHDLASNNIFISSTHDESAPDPIGLWGPDLAQDPSPLPDLDGALPAGITSGVDDYYMSWMAQQVASAIVRADRATQPAELKVAYAREPSNVQSCWSSYPFIDAEMMPVMQGLATSGGDAGHVLFTLVDVSTHDETLGFSGNPAYTAMLSGDWTGRLAEWLESDYPGSVGMEMAGLVGSVETPALYPEGTQVENVPGRLHNVPGSPVDGCSSVYPQPVGSSGKSIAPYSDALAFVNAYGKSVADTALAALRSTGAHTLVPASVVGQTQAVCLQLENNLFAAAFALDLFPDRPGYVDPSCAVGASLSGHLSLDGAATPASLRLSAPLYLRSEVGVVTLGAVQIAYSPGEIFPVTEIGGPYDAAQMPFPTDCYLPPDDYTCGSALTMTPSISADMTTPWRFFAGLGEDMLGYLFPPSNFVGEQAETLETPWSLYEEVTGGGSDRFGYAHADDPESVGPNAGLAVTDALASLLSADGKGTTVVPGMFVDREGHLCDQPFPTTGGVWFVGCSGFTGAVGVRVVLSGHVRDISVGSVPGDASGWATYMGAPDSGTAGTAYRYSTATRGVMLDGEALLVDVVSGANYLG